MALANPGRSRNGERSAQAILARLSEPDFRERMRLTEAECALLDKLAGGTYVRGAQSMIAAIKIKIESAYSKQVQPIEVHDARKRTVTIGDGRAITPEAAGLPSPRTN